jgi:hypothetical protein
MADLIGQMLTRPLTRAPQAQSLDSVCGGGVSRFRTVHVAD